MAPLSERAPQLVTSVFQTVLLATVAILSVVIDLMALLRWWTRRRSTPCAVYMFLPALILVHIFTNVALVPMEILVDVNVISQVERVPCVLFGCGHSILIFCGLFLRTCTTVATHSTELRHGTMAMTTANKVWLALLHVCGLAVAFVATLPLLWRTDLSIDVIPAYSCISPLPNASTHSVIRVCILLAFFVVTLATSFAVLLARLFGRVLQPSELIKTPVVPSTTLFVLCYGLTLAVDLAGIRGIQPPLSVFATAKVMFHMGSVFDTVIYGFWVPDLYRKRTDNIPKRVVHSPSAPIEMARLPTYAELHHVVSQYQESRTLDKGQTLPVFKIPL